MTGDFLSDEEVAALGLGRVGARVRISRRAVLLFPEHIAVGSDVRIDAFCLLVGNAEGITIGDHVHVSAYSCVLGRGDNGHRGLLHHLGTLFHLHVER